MIRKIRLCSKVIVQNSSVKKDLVAAGVNGQKILVAFGAVNRDVYQPINTLEDLKSPYAIIVGDCKPRKRPDLLRKVIESLGEIKFLIHGKNWKEQLGYQDRLPPNLQIRDFELANNPELIRSASAILNVAKIEGGPYPILEALASGTPVASSDSGFASEVVTEESGVIFPIEADVITIKNALLRAMKMKERVALSDLLKGKLSWKEHGLALYG